MSEVTEVRVPDIGDFDDVPGDRDPRLGRATRSRPRTRSSRSSPTRRRWTCRRPFAGTVDAAQRRDRRSGVAGQRAADAREPGRIGWIVQRRRTRIRRRGRTRARAGRTLPAPTRALGRLRARRAGARARRRPGRLHGRVPRRRPRAQDDPRRALRAPRRRLPERRLHPVEGAAARRASDRRGARRWAPTASTFEQPHVDLDALRAWKQSVVDKLTGGLDGLATPAQGRGRPRVGAVHRREQRRGRRPHDHVRQLHHRRRLAGRIAAASPRRQPHRHIHGRAGAQRRPGAPAGDRRRDHRPGDGDRLRRARLADHGRGDARPAAARVATRTSTRPLQQAHLRALRRDPPGDQGRGDREPRRRART